MTPLTLDRSAVVNLVEPARPLSQVRELLVSWAEAGASRDEIRSALNEVRSEYQAAGREAEEDRVLEVLDLVEDWVSPHLKLAFAGPDAAAEPPSTLTVATVLLPSEGEFQQIATDLVVPAVNEAGLEAVTPSQEASKANTVFTLIDKIKQSKVVVIDATGLDAFLLYALGVAHALETPAVVLSQDITELPFDLRSYNVVPYSTRLDEISRLKDDLRKVLFELAEVEYAVATPVKDIGGSRHKPTTAIHEEASAQEESPGIYDLIPSSLHAMEAIGTATAKFNELTGALGTVTQTESAEMEAANARGGPGAFGRSLLGIRTVTAHLDEHADQVAQILPAYREQWSSFVDDTLGWLELVDLQSEDDREAAVTFAAQLAELREVILGAAEGVEGFRGAVIELRARRLSKDLGRSLSRVDRQLKEWIDHALTGASHLERMRALLLERLHRPFSLG